MSTSTRPLPARSAGALAALALVGVLTACGSATTDTAATTTAVATSTVTSPAASPTTTPAAPGGTVTSPLVPSSDVSDSGKAGPIRKVTGTVSEGVEANCLVLVTHIGETLQPMGGDLKPGDKVTVEGQDVKGVMTTCMQGKPFRIIKVVERH
ncbi:hypothetical protein [Arsenicicoccus dermatophilus]|uniref:hypothetical protein n=1 Tax=Arsenicicoccus dermatophilus TaxID=1076331 RepID=UPI003916F29B